MPKFTETEKQVLDLFKLNTSFSFEGKKYTIIERDKPRPSKGECKTDVYVKLRDEDDECRELKISIKQGNAEFLENKIQYERAKEIFGADVDNILKNSISELENNFKQQELVFFDGHGKTDPHSIKLGWKFEIMNKRGGKLSGALKLNKNQVVDVYSGQQLPDEKKNANVNEKMVIGSGVANYMLCVEETKDLSLNDVVNALIPIEKYVEEHPQIYYACKALNFRSSEDKWDGDRPLSVYVDWTIKEGKLHGKLNFSEPLKKKANEIGNNLKSMLEKLNISEENFDDLKEKLHNDVKYYVKE